jgi:hypothetical protein
MYFQEYVLNNIVYIRLRGNVRPNELAQASVKLAPDLFGFANFAGLIVVFQH